MDLRSSSECKVASGRWLSRADINEHRKCEGFGRCRIAGHGVVVE